MHPKDVAQSAAAPAKGPPPGRWGHTPSIVTRLWLFISLPLVIWDTGYILLRPHSMPGGALHWPLWVPYELYGKVDYVYGWKAVRDHNGFTASQATLNTVETLFYLYYLSAVPSHGGPRLEGPRAGVAVLVGFSAALMTLSKTVLYCACLYVRSLVRANHLQGSTSTFPALRTLATTACRTCFSCGSFQSKHRGVSACDPS
jgi:hypothetical protein